MSVESCLVALANRDPLVNRAVQEQSVDPEIIRVRFGLLAESDVALVITIREFTQDFPNPLR
jgi:hypothetical protein